MGQRRSTHERPNPRETRHTMKGLLIAVPAGTVVWLLLYVLISNGWLAWVAAPTMGFLLFEAVRRRNTAGAFQPLRVYQFRHPGTRKVGGNGTVNPVPTRAFNILAIRPTVTETAYGKWLAVSEPGSSRNIGVIGDTEDDARERFTSALAKWQELHDAARADRGES